MPQLTTPRRKTMIGPVILIAIGLFFLLANFIPGFNPWWILSRYWPVILILVGAARLWDYYSGRNGTYTGQYYDSGVAVVLLLIVLLLIVGLWRRDIRAAAPERTTSRSVELQGATSVAANLHIPAGIVNLGPGSDKLLDADFRYTDNEPEPHVDYSVSDGRGELDVTQQERHRAFGRRRDDWNLLFNKTVPLDLRLDMGAGDTDLHAGELNLTNLTINIGAGHMNLDLTGPRKQDLIADIHGGAGQATIRLPKDVGVRVHATGGLGTVDARGLLKQGGNEYVNAAYGNTPTSINLSIEGGVGEIDLRQE